MIFQPLAIPWIAFYTKNFSALCDLRDTCEVWWALNWWQLTPETSQTFFDTKVTFFGETTRDVKTDNSEAFFWVSIVIYLLSTTYNILSIYVFIWFHIMVESYKYPHEFQFTTIKKLTKKINNIWKIVELLKKLQLFNMAIKNNNNINNIWIFSK